MPAETYRGIDFSIPAEIIPAKTVKEKAEFIKQITDRSLVPPNEEAIEIAENIALAALCADGVAEGLLINNQLAVIPVITAQDRKLVAFPRLRDKSVLLYQLNQDALITFNRCKLSQGEVMEAGYLNLHVKNFRYSAEEAGLYDFRTAPVSRYATQVHVIAAQSSDNIIQMESFLLNMRLKMPTFPGL